MLHFLLNNLDHLRHWFAYTWNPNTWGGNVPADLIMGTITVLLWPKIRSHIVSAIRHDEEALKRFVEDEYNRLHHEVGK